MLTARSDFLSNALPACQTTARGADAAIQKLIYRSRPETTQTRSTSEVSIRPDRGLGSYGRQTVANCPRKPRSGERGYGLGEYLPSEVGKSFPRLRFGLVWDVSNLTGSGIARISHQPW